MNEPTPEDNPSDTRKQIAIVCAILKTLKQLNPQEKAEAIKLKAEIDRLTNGPFESGSMYGGKGGPPPSPIEPPKPVQAGDKEFFGE